MTSSSYKCDIIVLPASGDELEELGLLLPTEGAQRSPEGLDGGVAVEVAAWNLELLFNF